MPPLLWGQSNSGWTEYFYNGEGQLHRVEDSSGTYCYTYDSTGQLITSEKRDAYGKTLMRADQQYNDAGQLVGQSWDIDGTVFSESYTYNSENGSLNTMTTADGQTLRMTYDDLQRLSSVSSDFYSKEYTYKDLTESTTSLVSQLYYIDLPTPLDFGYTYDALGNIATYTAPDGEVITYTYDDMGQLLSAAGDQTYAYTYDSAGNILTANGHTYAYGNANWKDLLTAFDGEEITYDDSGNPLSYFNGTRWTFTWQDGRRLASATDGITEISYAYDGEGLRTNKWVGDSYHEYIYYGGQLLREWYDGDILDFFYDTNGHPYALNYNNTTYYYITNLQGDVIYLIDEDGETVASYEYDPYGNILSATGDMAEINPLRYRGYYYDTELGMYYLQSRYYNPMVGRFINADVVTFLGVNDTTLSYNLFAYCENNPILSADYTGYISVPSWTISWAIDAVIMAIASYWSLTWMTCAAPIKFMAKKLAVKFFTKSIVPLLKGITNVIVKVIANVMVWLGQKLMAGTINLMVKMGIAAILAEPLRAITMITSLGGLIAGLLDYATDKNFDGKVKLG